MIACKCSSALILCAFSVGLSACAVVSPDAMDGSERSEQWTKISDQNEYRGRRWMFARAACIADYECAGFIKLEAVDFGGGRVGLEGHYVDLLFEVEYEQVVIRCLRLGDGGLGDIASLRRELSLSVDYDWPNARGKLHDLDKRAKVEVNGMPMDATQLELWLRADGLYVQQPGNPDPIIRYGFPDTECDDPAQIGSVCGAGRIYWRLSPAMTCE